MKRLMVGLIATAALVLMVSTGGAATITYYYTNSFSGGGGYSGTPTATLTDISGGVRITMSLVGVDDARKTGEWDFNIDSAFFPTPTTGIGAVTPSYVSGALASTADIQQNAFKADGDGYYDLGFEFNPAFNLVSGTTSVYDILYSDLTTASFNFLSVNGDPGAGDYLSAMHLMSLDTVDGSDSIWLSPGSPPPAVPEPGTMLLLGSGLVGFAVWGRKKFRK